MNSKEFFKKLEKGEFEGEGLGYIHDVIVYLNKPKGENKVYNIASEFVVRDLERIVNNQFRNFETKVCEIKLKSGRTSYQLGIFYSKPSD